MPMNGKQMVLLAVSVLLASAFIMPSSFYPESSAYVNLQTVQEVYPAADIVITSDQDGATVIIRKTTASESTDEWTSETIPSMSEIDLCYLSEVKGGLNVVYEGGDVKRLTFFYVDSAQSLNSAIDLDFRMLGGSIQTLTFFNISKVIAPSLSKTYDGAQTPIRNATITLESGFIDLYNPTSDIISISDYRVYLGNGMTVNKFHTTGENGRYPNVAISMNGATVGYMANVSSKIGSLRYDILSGSVDYLCIGADSERSSTIAAVMSYEQLSTSYATGEVSLHVLPAAKIGSCIMGAGILSMPHLLCNGEVVTEQITHKVVIDASKVTVVNDTAFLTDTRTSAYHFNYYKVGSNPFSSNILQKVRMNNTNIKVYSESGIWDSISSCVIPVGAILSLDADFIIESDGSMALMKGSTVYNSGNIIVKGTLDIGGNLINNNLIQCWNGSVIIGVPEGVGTVADYVVCPEGATHLLIESDRVAVILVMDYVKDLESIEVDLEYEGIVSIYLDSFEGMAGTLYVSLIKKGPYRTFNESIELDVRGLEKYSLSPIIGISIPTDSEVCTAAYVYNEEDEEYEIISTSEYESSIVFPAGSYRDFYLLQYTTERPALPEDPVEKQEVITSIDYFLIAAIIAVLAVTVYILVTMKRD